MVLFVIDYSKDQILGGTNICSQPKLSVQSFSSSGGTDVLDWTDYGTETGTYLNGLNLTLTNISYVSVKVQNGAMMWSNNVTSTPVLIIGGNKKGIYRCMFLVKCPSGM